MIEARPAERRQDRAAADGVPDGLSTPAYPFSERREMLAFVPAAAKRILDVGCGPGGFGAALRQEGRHREVWAVDADPEVAAKASTHYDRMLVGSFPLALAGVAERFDCIVFNDVLEHMVDPWSALRAARSLLARDGVVVASIPNVRNLRVVLDLVVRGRWTYVDIGILDRTHVRFFTASSIRSFFADCGFTVDRLRGINAVGQSSRLFGRLPRLVLGEFAFTGFAVEASPVDA